MDKLTPEAIAQAKLKEIADKKNADLESQKTPEQKVLDAKKIQDDKQAVIDQAKKDEEILAKKPEDLKEEEKKRVEELHKVAKDKEDKLPVEDKVKKIQELTQRRIDEIVSKLKETEDRSSKENRALKDELEKLKGENVKLEEKLNEGKPRSEDELATKQFNENVKAYLEEDKELPREKRREMSKEELDDWLLEDLGGAQEWMTERSLRRAYEKQGLVRKFKQETFTKDILDKQDSSFLKVKAKHPELDTVAREDELKKEGKTPKEIGDILRSENEKYRICSEIVKESPDKFYASPDGPELVMEEMEKRLTSKSKPKQDDASELETLKAQHAKELEERDAEIARLKGIDEGVNSNANNQKPPVVKETDADKLQKKLAHKAGITDEQLRKQKERRSKIPGAL